MIAYCRCCPSNYGEEEYVLSHSNNVRCLQKSPKVLFPHHKCSLFDELTSVILWSLIYLLFHISQPFFNLHSDYFDPQILDKIYWLTTSSFRIAELVNTGTSNLVFGDSSKLESVDLHDLHPASW